MALFEKTLQEEQAFQAFAAKVEKLERDLAPFSNQVNLDDLTKVRTNFLKKTEDFFRADRKLNIGVIGQVKAGKSSFLNTLLFEGKKVLPSAATPKTATLTKIEYGSENQLQVEYYTAEEWAVLERNAQVDSPDSEFEAAREIMRMAAVRGIFPADYIARGTETFPFDTAQHLMEQLNDYVGENGTYTAMVKNVTIQLDRPELRDISVVDTPGLNDAIASRTDRTRQFIGLCDVVFFLSRTSQFLDSNDIRLLTAQLPQKGVKELVMISSRFDNGLDDVILDADSITEAISIVQTTLTQNAATVVEKNSVLPGLGKILEPCRRPVFVSSMCWNMAQKDPEEYNAQERLVFHNLNDEHDDVDRDILRRIGNMDTVQQRFDQIVAQKDSILSQKAKGFLPEAQHELQNALKNLKTKAETHLKQLRCGDQASLNEQMADVTAQINGIKGRTEEVFGTLLDRLERNKLDTLRELREAGRDISHLEERTGTDVHYHSHWVSDFSIFHPFRTWGTGHYEHTSYETHYNYLMVNDAIENIRTFGIQACTAIEQSFSSSVDIPAVKQQLLSAVVNNLDTSSKHYDAAYFRWVTEHALNVLEFPVMKLDLTKEQEALTSQFSDEVRDSRDRARMQSIMTDISGRLLNTATERFQEQAAQFRSKLEHMRDSFSDELLKEFQADFDQLSVQFEHKEQEIHAYEDLLILLKAVSNM